MQSEFKIVAVGDSDALVILSGVLDAWNAAPARDAIRRASWRGSSGVSVDVSGLATIDNFGIRALATEALCAHDAGKPLRLRHVRQSLIARLTHNGLLDLFGLESASEMGLFHPAGSVRVVWKEDRFRFPADATHLPGVRHRIVQFGRTIGLRDEALDNLHLAAGEAVTNAIRHGCGSAPSLQVQVRCAAADDRLVVEVHDPGPGFDPAAITMPDVDSLLPGGMGIHLMRCVMDAVEYEFSHEGTVTRLRRSVPRGRPGDGAGFGQGCIPSPFGEQAID